ncbi:MAG: hypothetical protein L0H64_11240 [Pseudonocardia sp.]|nr:hypothetical protein [Pseudonocardia sp.]
MTTDSSTTTGSTAREVVQAYLGTWNSPPSAKSTPTTTSSGSSGGLGPVGGEPIVIGFDVAVLDQGGRIHDVRGFLGRVPG